ncbi:MAG: PQQ-dependent sugar dehydrogenase [Acidimicrobiia bacterium]|nr:PQQ-dependent sugar dehydrogenase [Acidimicrobiia bacterium]
MSSRLVIVFCLVLPLAWTGAAFADPVVGPRPQAVDDIPSEGAPGHRVETWIGGLEAPWSLAFLPDARAGESPRASSNDGPLSGRALVSERPGRIRLIQNGALRPEPYAPIDVAIGGEGGLMGLALHPDFPRAPFVYVMHTYFPGPLPAFARRNKVIRLRHLGDTGAFDRVVLDGIPGALNHNGGRIGFGPDRMLYVTTGEIYEAELAQDPASLAGKILRVTPEGDVPADNPISGSPVWSLGHRNPQGLAWQPATGDLFASEHGPSGEFGLGGHDEINLIVRGVNYGWPRAVGAPNVAAYRDPLVVWKTPTTPPSGIAFWRGDLYVATLRSQALMRIALARAGNDYRVTRIERWFAHGDNRPGRLRDAVAGPDGALYVLTNNRDGRGRPREGDDRILRITRP